MTTKKGFIFSLILLDLFVVVGCEKNTAPFSSNSSLPLESTAKIYVTDGSNPAANVTIRGIDPSGNIFTTVSDSDGFAIFDPIPFNPGKWVFQMPDQNHRCFGNVSASTSILSGATSQAATFQYGVPANMSIPAPTLTTSSNAITESYSMTLNTQNDCGITWTFTTNVNGSNFSWSLGGSGGLGPGSSYSVSLTSSQSVSLTIVGLITPPFSLSSINFTLKSILGQSNGGPTTF